MAPPQVITLDQDRIGAGPITVDVASALSN